jgi:hypothetical protein
MAVEKNQQQKVNSCVGHLLVGPSILILRITSSFQLKKNSSCTWWVAAESFSSRKAGR